MVKLSLKMLKLLLKTLVLYFCEDWDAVFKHDETGFKDADVHSEDVESFCVSPDYGAVPVNDNSVETGFPLLQCRTAAP
jgi:hypothetical protein